MNDKQMLFAEEYSVDQNATAAAKRAGYSERTAYSQGQRLLKHVEVRQAIQQAQAEHRERTAVTVESITENLRAAYDLAAKNGHAGAMVQAEMGIAKIHGMLVDRTEDLTKSAEDMTRAERTAELDRVQAELDALARPKVVAISA